MRITWLGHAAFRIETNSTVILIDPFLKNNPQLQKVDFQADFDKMIAGVTHIALTHGHSHHLGDTIEIAQTRNIPVIANADLSAWLALRGVTQCLSGNIGGTLRHSDFCVTFVPALHSSATIEEGGQCFALGNANGLVFHFDRDLTVYHMGDTDIFSDMQIINELHRPEIGLVPIGDIYTMGGAVAALACLRYFNFKTVIPCHYGTFPVLDQTAEKFLLPLKGEAITALSPKIGEILIF